MRDLRWVMTNILPMNMLSNRCFRMRDSSNIVKSFHTATGITKLKDMILKLEYDMVNMNQFYEMVLYRINKGKKVLGL